MSNISRRSFLKSSMLIAGTASAFHFTSASYSQIAGANNRVRFAIAGCGGRGSDITQNGFAKLKDVEVVYAVDADINRANSLAANIEKNFGNKPQTHQDIRIMLEEKDIDAVAVASCNHWHSLMAIWACQAGKDVYVEKPCSQKLFEGRKLIEAAAKYKRFVQHGTQRRSSAGWARASAAIQQKKFGQLIAAKVYCHRPRGPLGFKPTAEPPQNLDWNLWIGPASETPYHANLVPYNWHWFWNTGNGEIGNNGVHYFDLCRWAMQTKHPDSVISFGTRFVKDKTHNYKDQAETPNIQFVLYDFGGVPLIYESCNIAGPREKWSPREEAEFYTEQGILRGDKFFPYKNAETLEIGEESVTVKIDDFSEPAPDGNFGNFINAVRNRESVKLNAPITEGHYSAAVCHWGNAAYRLGESGEPTPLTKIRETMGDNKILQMSIDKVLENVLDQLPGVKLEEIPFKIGPKLRIDGDKEKFIDNATADEQLTRKPREGFAVPENV
ncbi:MAG: Gfo/Idh/MocA family oxidoreductase [Planctomycetaceae bacterium]|nr:Gfo/Idh/MocA family oxidoreductase [Planctomycetaceae bacterium]